MTIMVKKLVPLTTEDWDIILRLGRVARIATVRETGHIDEEYENMMWHEYERKAQEERGECRPIEHPEDMHQNIFNPYW